MKKDVKKEVTREMVIDAVLAHNPGSGSLFDPEKLASDIADALGLEEPKKLEQVRWISAWGDGSGAFFGNEKEAGEHGDSDCRVFPALITELSPDDPRIPK